MFRSLLFTIFVKNEMPDLPIHKVVQQSHYGVFAKEISALLSPSAVGYAHRDDYYIFGVVEKGTCRVSVDFKDYDLSEGDTLCVQPGQVHKAVDVKQAKAYLLFVDGVFIDLQTKRILAEYALSPVPIKMNASSRVELAQLFSMIMSRMNPQEEDRFKTVLQYLSGAVVEIITDGIRKYIGQNPKSRRQVEIALAFKERVSNERILNRSSAYYAQALHVSSVYLNEVIRCVMGMSVGRYIQSELVLRAKRMLVYSAKSIKEISVELGIEDYAYFTRLFTKAVGINPSAYRKNYLE